MQPKLHTFYFSIETKTFKVFINIKVGKHTKKRGEKKRDSL